MTIGEDFDLLFRLLLGGSSLVVLPEAYYLYRRQFELYSYRLSPDDCGGLVRACEGYLINVPEESRSTCQAKASIAPGKTGPMRNWCRASNPVRSPGQRPMLARHPSLIGASGKIAGRTLRTEHSRSFSRTGRTGDSTCFKKPFEVPCDKFLPHVLPDKESGWTPPIVAALIAKAGHGNARLRARGHAGLHGAWLHPGMEKRGTVAPDEG